MAADPTGETPVSTLTLLVLTVVLHRGGTPDEADKVAALIRRLADTDYPTGPETRARQLTADGSSEPSEAYATIADLHDEIRRNSSYSGGRW